MKRMTVTLRYQVVPALPGPTVSDVLKTFWGPGHQLSVLTGDDLTVVVKVRGLNRSEQVEIVDDKVRALWKMVGAGSLRLVFVTVNGELVTVGGRRPGEEGDGAGVREPRRPKMPPGSTSAALAVPKEPRDRDLGVVDDAAERGRITAVA